MLGPVDSPAKEVEKCFEPEDTKGCSSIWFTAQEIHVCHDSLVQIATPCCKVWRRWRESEISYDKIQSQKNVPGLDHLRYMLVALLLYII